MAETKNKKDMQESKTLDLNGNGIIDSGDEAKLAADDIAKKISADSGIWKIIVLLKAMVNKSKASEDYNSPKLRFHDKGEEEKVLKVSPKVLEEIVDKVLTNPKLKLGNKKLDVDFTPLPTPDQAQDKTPVGRRLK